LNKAATAAPESGSLERALHIVRLLATAGDRGAGLTDIARTTQLPHPTVHRLLQRLTTQGLTRQLASSRRYALGPLAFEIGLAAAQQFDIRAVCRPALVRIAQDVGDTSYLVVRSGIEAVCIDRQEGPSPIRVFTLEIGSRRPLGLGAAGLAILGALRESDREVALAQLTDVVIQQGKLSMAEFEASVERTREQGYSFIRNRVTLGVSAVGVAVRDGLDTPFAAISVAAVDARMTQQRVSVITKVLRREAKELQRALKEGKAFSER